MICITHTTPGNAFPDGWILARNLTDATRRADNGGQTELADGLRRLQSRYRKPPRGVMNLAAIGVFGWTMIAGEAGR